MKKILIIAPNWIGDAVMSLPLVGYLGAVPGACLAVCATEYVARIYRGLDEIAELLIIPRTGRVSRVISGARRLRRLRVDGAVVLPPSFSSALTLFLSRVPVRTGYAFDGRAMLLTDTLPSGGSREEHLSRNYLRLGKNLLARLQLDAPAGEPHPPVKVFPGDRSSLDALLCRLEIEAGSYAVVVPGATYGPAKTWPRQNFRRLLELLSPRVPVVLGGGEGERRLCEELAAGLPRVVSCAGQTSLGEFAALLQSSRMVIANDSGAPHIAGAVGAPAIVIFGSTSPRWTAPLGERIEIIAADVACSPCFREECPTELECFSALTPELVMERAAGLLEKKSR